MEIHRRTVHGREFACICGRVSGKVGGLGEGFLAETAETPRAGSRDHVPTERGVRAMTRRILWVTRESHTWAGGRLWVSRRHS